MPLILTHGWPGSFLEMLKILPLLTDPAAYGHDAADSFVVIVPLCLDLATPRDQNNSG